MHRAFNKNQMTHASTGALVSIFNDDTTSDDFDIPVGVSSDGKNVWIANLDGDSVTQLSAPSGSLVQVISG